MLDRNEISSKLPCITDRTYNQANLKLHNTIKKTIVNNKSIDLFLPIKINSSPKEILTSFEHTNTAKTIQHNSPPLRNSDNTNNDSSHLKCLDSTANNLTAIQNKVKKAHEKLKTFENEPNTRIDIGQAFNIKTLSHKVKLITDSLKTKGNYKLIRDNKNKDTKAVKEYLKIRKSVERIQNQSMILNVEYDTLDNQIKHSRNRQIIEKPYSKNTLKTSNTDATIDNHLTHRSTNDHLNHYKTRSNCEMNKLALVESRSQSKIRERTQLSQIDKRYTDRFKKYQLYFHEKYKKRVAGINREQKLHLNSNVFANKEIDSIMKSKNEVVIDILMSKYINNYNKHIDLKKILQGKIRTTVNKKKKNASKSKHKDLINKKLNQALIEWDKCSISKGKHSIKDHIKGLNNYN